MRLLVASLCLSACLSSCVFGQAADKRPLTPDDYYTIKVPDDPMLSPNGKMVAFTIISADREKDRKETAVWLREVDGDSPARRLTGEESSSSPRWSPDGESIAFLSARHDPQTGTVGKAQVYLLSLHGGEPRPITKLKNGVTYFQWSPDGSKLVCVSRIGPSDSLPAKKKPSDVLDYTFPEIKADGFGYYTDQRAHVWTVNVRDGASKQLTFGDQANDSEPRWSPDGTQIAFLSTRTDANTVLSGNDAIFVVPSAGGEPRKLPLKTMGMGELRWSPDGKQIAYVGSPDATFVPKLFVTSLADGTTTQIGKDITYPRETDWTSDGHALLYRSPEKGDVLLSTVDIASGKVKSLLTRVTVGRWDSSETAHVVVYTASDNTHPAQLFASNLDGSNRRQLTQLNIGLLNKVLVQPDEPISYKSVDGWTIEGFFTKPLNWQPGKSYPMVLMVHGGPNGMWGSNWNLTEQCFAAHGWAVLKINPRGSSGYGETFQRGVYKEFGGKAYQDLMIGVDHALAKYPWIDRERLGVVGHSYGGFMTNWIIGHTTRFAAAVPQSGMTDFISDDGARDAFYGHARDFGVHMLDDPATYLRNSPITYANKVKTPTLFMYGQMDMRVPVGQAEEYFRAITHYGTPAELVIFPGEPHTPGRTPRHVDDWMRWQIYWFERWLDKNPQAIKPNAINGTAE